MGGLPRRCDDPRSSPDYRQPKMETRFQRRRGRAMTPEEGRGVEASEKEVSDEHGYQTCGGNVRQRERQKHRWSAEPGSGK